ncbi:MAG: alanine--glyoxylate aminotransferase family protein [Anaerolineales bacterium]
MKSHKLLMIPGPIEFDPAVLAAMSEPTSSHTDVAFIQTFGEALEKMRQVFQSSKGQPYIVAGSGTFAMDVVAANLIEEGDQVLLLNIGYFSERFGEILERYGAKVTQIKAAIGARPELQQVEAELKKGGYKALVFPHVDTSTGVLNDVPMLAALARQHGVLCVVDGVCSVGAEELRMDEWGVDVALTASQKAIGVPPGLALWMVSQRALEACRNRKKPPANYYGDWLKWLPVMQAHEARQFDYFATPPINLIRALNVSLTQIVTEGMENRYARHRKMSRVFKAAMMALELDQIPVSEEVAAHTLSAIRYPKGVQAGEFLSGVAQQGIILSGGLLPPIKQEYFRVGHMGNISFGDLIGTVSAIEQALQRLGYRFVVGSGVAAAQRAVQESEPAA